MSYEAIDEASVLSRSEHLVVGLVGEVPPGRGQEALWILLGAVLRRLAAICGPNAVWNTLRRMDLMATGQERP
jgi:hypothetical protein